MSLGGQHHFHRSRNEQLSPDKVMESIAEDLLRQLSVDPEVSALLEDPFVREPVSHLIRRSLPLPIAFEKKGVAFIREFIPGNELHALLVPEDGSDATVFCDRSTVMGLSQKKVAFLESAFPPGPKRSFVGNGVLQWKRIDREELSFEEMMSIQERHLQQLATDFNRFGVKKLSESALATLLEALEKEPKEMMNSLILDHLPQVGEKLKEYIANHPETSIRDFNFARGAKSDIQAVWRLQWAQTFPAFWSLSSKSDIVRSIDSGEEFIPIVTRMLECEKWLVRRVRTLPNFLIPDPERERERQLERMEEEFEDEEDLDYRTPNERWRDEADPLRELPNQRSRDSISATFILMEGLSGLPPDRFPDRDALIDAARGLKRQIKPKTDAGLVVCASWMTGYQLNALSHGKALPFVPNLRALVSATNGKWKEVAHQLRDFSGQKAHEIDDFISCCAHSITLPKILRTALTDAQARGEGDRFAHGDIQMLRRSAFARTALFFSSTWHVGQLLRKSDAWHATFGRNEDGRPKTKVRGVQWPAWFGKVRISGTTFTPLTSAAELSAEGQRMGHCVGSYVPECLSGESQIYAVQTPSGERTTLQLVAEKKSVRGGGEVWKISNVQHLGRFNFAPCSESKSAVNALIKLLNNHKDDGSPRIHPKVDEVLEYLEKRKSTSLVDVCGFDFTSDKQWEKARLEFLPYFPQPLQALSADELVDEITRVAGMAYPLDLDKGENGEGKPQSFSGEDVLGWITDA